MRFGLDFLYCRHRLDDLDNVCLQYDSAAVTFYEYLSECLEQIPWRNCLCDSYVSKDLSNLSVKKRRE